MRKKDVVNDWYYLLIPHFIIVRKDLNLTEKAILGMVYAASMHDELKECRLSYGYMSACLNISKRQVINICLSLHTRHYLRISQDFESGDKRKNRNIYTLFFDGCVLLNSVVSVPMVNGENNSLQKGEIISPEININIKNNITHTHKENIIKELELKPSNQLTREEELLLMEYYKNKYDLICKIAKTKWVDDD